jgi:formate hydrogenlyase transcriptional activator
MQKGFSLKTGLEKRFKIFCVPTIGFTWKNPWAGLPQRKGTSVSGKKPGHSVERSAPDRRLEFEKLLADLSARLVALPPEEVDGEIRRALKEILEFFRIDRCTLLRLLPGKTSWQVTHNAAAAGISLYPIRTPSPISIVPWIARKLAVEREVFSFASLEELPEEAAVDKRTLEKFDIQSGLFIPIAALRSSEYSLGINSREKDRTYPAEHIPQLRLLGELFVNAVERNMGETALRESEERLNLAASAAEAGLWMMEEERGIVWSTQKLRELLHFTPDEELPFDRFLAAVHPDDRERVRVLVQQSLERQEALDMEYRIVQSDGKIRWLSSRGNPPSQGSGLPKRLTGVSIDVTERKEMEAELRERLNEIERLKLQLEKENLYLREEIRTGQGFQKIVGNSEPLQYVFFKIRQVAPTDATVLVLGETGTGKGMVAHAIHEMSARKDRTMITVNCAALPANLIESELFGREKGAFTGAHAKQVGRFEVADGGTIFLDEIGEMPLELQAKLLRVLQEGEFERLGSSRTIKVDVRVIASTSRDMKVEVRSHRFREDLFYRLNVFPISMPPLRMRPGDIPQLVRHFVDKYARKMARPIKTVPKSTMKSLQGYSWPGNVRELENVIERAVITSAGPVLRLADPFESEPPEGKEESLKRLMVVEREHILKVLQKTRWKIDGEGGAASLLGLHPSTLRFRIKKLGIERP